MLCSACMHACRCHSSKGTWTRAARDSLMALAAGGCAAEASSQQACKLAGCSLRLNQQGMQHACCPHPVQDLVLSILFAGCTAGVYMAACYGLAKLLHHKRCLPGWLMAGYLAQPLPVQSGSSRPSRSPADAAADGAHKASPQKAWADTNGPRSSSDSARIGTAVAGTSVADTTLLDQARMDPPAASLLAAATPTEHTGTAVMSKQQLQYEALPQASEASGAARAAGGTSARQLARWAALTAAWFFYPQVRGPSFARTPEHPVLLYVCMSYLRLHAARCAHWLA
jgi:hypothetical protein